MKKQKPRVAVRFKNSEEERQCKGMFVATPSFTSNQVIRDEEGKVIASKDPSVVTRKVDVMGFEHPVIIPIPEIGHWVYSALESA